MFRLSQLLPFLLLASFANGEQNPYQQYQNGKEMYQNNNQDGYNNGQYVQVANEAEYYNQDEYAPDWWTDEMKANQEYPATYQIVENCDSALVEVTEVTIKCDSPYAYYYGSGAHYSSDFCDYGDHALVTVFLNVNEDWLSANRDTIYMTMGVYAMKYGQSELLWAARSVEFCETFVGHACTKAGQYAFAFRVSLDYIMTDQNLFVPQVEIGFSSRQDEGYNLGGVNIDCQFSSTYRAYDPWYVGYHKSQSWAAGSFAPGWGLIIGVVALLTAASVIYWKRNDGESEFTGNSLFNADLIEKENSNKGESSAALLFPDSEGTADEHEGNQSSFQGALVNDAGIQSETERPVETSVEAAPLAKKAEEPIVSASLFPSRRREELKNNFVLRRMQSWSNPDGPNLESRCLSNAIQKTSEQIQCAGNKLAEIPSKPERPLAITKEEAEEPIVSGTLFSSRRKEEMRNKHLVLRRKRSW